MPLTDTAIRKTKPRVKPHKLYDSRGLYLEIAPRGTKAWRFKYRFAGREKRISIGICPEVSLKLARRRRDEARKLLARDIDPSGYRKARKPQCQQSPHFDRRRSPAEDGRIEEECLMAAWESVRAGRLFWTIWVADGVGEDLRRRRLKPRSRRKGDRGVSGWTVTSGWDPCTGRS